MMSKITKRVAGMLALFLATCATGGAWAAAPTPTAVWESGQFEDAASSHGGYSITLPTGATIVNGNIVLAGTEATGALIDVASVDSTQTSVSVLVKYSGVSAPTKACSFVSTYVAGNSSFDMHAISVGASLSLKGQYNNTTHASNYAFSSPAPALTASGYFLFTYNSDAGTGGYAGSTLDDLSGGKNTDLKFGSRTISKIGIGGPTGMTADTYPTWDSGVTIEAVAIFVGQELSASAAKEYYFPEAGPAADFDYATTISENTTFSDITTWTKGSGTPDENSTVYIACENDAVLTISGSLSLERLKVVDGSITLADGASVSAAKIAGPISCPSGTHSITGATITGAITASTSSTINFTDCAINGGISAPQNGNVVVNTYGTVTFGSSADNDFKYSTTLNIESGTTTYNSSSDRKLWCNINVKSGATFVNEKGDGFNYDAAAGWPIHAYIRGTLTMNGKWTLGNGNYIHLYNGAVINGSGNLHFNTGTGKVVVEEDGDYTIAAPFNTGNGTAKVEVKGSATLTLSNVPNNLKIEKAGTGTLKWANKNLIALSGTGGTIEIDASGSNLGHSFTSSTYNGVLKLTGTSQNNLVGSSTTRCFGDSVRPELIADAAATYLSKDAYNGQTLYVRNLSGKSGATLDARFTGGPISYTLDTLQERDTEYLGKFNNDTPDSRSFALNVTGNNEGGIHTLTLGGDNQSTNTLTVSGYGKVKFNSSGKWSKGIVVVGNNGVLESENSAAIAATLKVEEGATLKFADGVPLAATAYDWSAVTSDGSVNVDLSEISPSATPVTLIASDVTVTKDRFAVLGSQTPATLSVDGEALKVTFANVWRDGTWLGEFVANENATLYISQNSTLSVTEALSLGAVTVVKESEGNVTLTISGAGALTTEGWTIPEGVTVNTPTSMSISGTVSGDGVINVPANTTLAMTNVTCSTKVTVSGTLETSGTTTLSGANTSAAGSLIRVLSDETSLSTLLKGITGDIRIDSNATLKMVDSLNGSGELQYYDNIDPDGTTTLDIYGTLNIQNNNFEFGSGITINLYDGAQITAWATSNSTTYGDLTWLQNGKITVAGEVTLNTTVRTVTGVAAEFDVAGSDSLLTITKNFVSQTGSQSGGGSLTKTGAGTLKFTQEELTKPITINAGKVQLRRAFTSGLAISIAEGAELELGVGMGSTDVNVTGVSFAGVTGNGTIRYSSEHSGYYTEPISAANMFATTLHVANDNTGKGIVIPWNGGVTTNRTVSGSGKYRSDWNGSSGVADRYFLALQDANSEWSGIFHENDRLHGMKVAGVEGAANKTLTLSGTQTQTNTLEVETTGSVNLTGTWVGDTTVDGEFGGTGSVTGALTFNAGSTFKVWETDADGLVATGALTLPVSGTVTVDVSSLTIDTSTSKTLLSASSGINLSKFHLLGSETHMLTGSSTTLQLEPIAATVTSGDGLTVQTYTTPNAALERLSALQASGDDLDAYATVVLGSTTYTAEQLAAYNIIYDSTNSRYVIAEAKISSTLYITIEEAIAAATVNDVIELTKDISKENIAVNKAIEFSEGNYTFTGSFTGSGTITLAAMLKSAAAARWASAWTGTVVLPAITTDIEVNFNNYGRSGSVVQVTSMTNGWLSNAEVLPEINLAGDMTLIHFSASFSNTFNKLSGSGTFTLAADGTSDGYVDGYFLVKDVSDFTGSISVAAPGLAIGAAKPSSPTTYGQIYLTTNATIASGKTWTATNGIYVNSTNTLTVKATATAGGSVIGSGRIVFEGALPSSGLQTSLQNSSNWTGTVELKDYVAPTELNGHKIIVLSNYGNNNSTVALNGVTSTMFANDSYSDYPAVTLKEIEIGAGGWTDNSGLTYSVSMSYTANLTGHGPLNVKTGGDGTVMFIGNHTFDGPVTMDSGTQKQVAFMRTSSDKIPDVVAGAIVVAGGLDMSIAPGKTWTATGGIKLDGSLTVLTEEEGTATSGTISAYRNGARIDTTRDAIAGTTTYKSTPVFEISDNQASLGDVSISGNYVLSGSGGAYMSSLAIADGASLTYDPVITPLYVNATPTFTGTGKLKLVSRYAGVTCGKFHLVTYPASASVTGTLNDLVDSTSFNNATYTVTEETVKVVTVNSSAVSGYTETPYKQLVLKVGNYDTAAKEMSIAQFGDSITEGIWRNNDGSGTAYRGTPNYRIPLMQLLEAYGYKPEARGYRKVGSQDANGVKADDNYEWHTGISAQRIYTGNTYTWAFRAGFMESIEAHLEQVGVTDVITLKIGTNDSIGNETADNMFEGWTNLVWKIVRMRPTSKIVVCTPITMRQAENNAPGLRTKIAEYMAKSAAEGGFPDDQVTMISGEEIVTGDASDYLDNVHPNWNGHMKLANAWLPAVTNAFESMKVGDVIVHADSGVYTPQTVASAENATELAAYRAGYVKLATFTNFNGKVSTWGETPYYYVNDTYTNTPMKRVAYFVARKTTASPDTRYVWVDMDADETTTGTTLADFGVPKSASVNCVVSNLHIYSNSSAIENVAPEVDGVKGTLMLTEKGVSGAAGISSADAPAGVTWDSSKAVFDWNDSIVDSPTWGVMSVARTFDGVEPTNHRKLLAAQMLFDFNGFNGTMTNAFGLGDFAVHGPYDYANNSVDNFNLNWTFMTAKDEMPTMDARAVETGVIEIWGQLDLTPAFTYDAYTGGTGPTGWFSSWGGEQFKTDRFRIGPNAGPNTNYVYYVFHDSDNSKAHPWVGLNNDTIKSGSFSFAIYADVSQMESDKGVIVAFGNTSNGLILYREDAYVKLAHVVNGAITTTDWVPGVAVLSGYHLYTVSYDTQTGEAKLYLDNMACAATTGEGIYRHLVTTDSQKGLNAGFQIGAIYQGFEYNSTQTGFTFGSGLAVCAVRGFEVPLSQASVDLLAEEFPATNGTVSWNVDPNTLSQNVSYTYLAMGETVDDSHYLGVTHGTLTIPEGSTVNAKQVRVLNTNQNNNRAEVNIAGTLNVTSTSTRPDVHSEVAEMKGILFGNNRGQGTYNITGTLNGENAYLETVNGAGTQTINIDGGTVKVKGLYANNGNSTVNLYNDGILEVSEIPTGGSAITYVISNGTYRITGGDTMVTTPINFIGTASAPSVIDPWGNEITMTTESLMGRGVYITVVDNSPSHDGKVIFPAVSEQFTGYLILNDSNVDNIDISSYNGRILLRSTTPSTIAKLNGFTGVVKIDQTETYDIRGVDLSSASLDVGGLNCYPTIRMTAGYEGNVILTTGICELYVDNDDFFYYGHVFTGVVNEPAGALFYVHSESAPSDMPSHTFVEGSRFTTTENGIVRDGWNIAPYYRIFVGDETGVVGNLNDKEHWMFDPSVLPETGNAAIKVTNDFTLVVNVANTPTFGELQITGRGTVILEGSGAITITSGVYVNRNTTLIVRGGLTFSGDAGIHLSADAVELYSGRVYFDLGTEASPYAMPPVAGIGSGTVRVMEGRYVTIDNMGVRRLEVLGNASIDNPSYFRILELISVQTTGTLSLSDVDYSVSWLNYSIAEGGVLNINDCVLSQPDGSMVNNGTVNITGASTNTITTLEVNGELNIASTAALVDVASLTGTGRIAYTGKMPDGVDSNWWNTGTASDGWRGTLAICDYGTGAETWDTSKLGSAYSTLEASNCYIIALTTGVENGPHLKLTGKGLKISKGSSGNGDNVNTHTDFQSLSGDGILETENDVRQIYRFTTGDQFAGSITNTDRRIVFDSTTAYAYPDKPTRYGSITICPNTTASLGDGAVWKTHIMTTIRGTLNVRGSGIIDSPVELFDGARINLSNTVLTVNGALTLPASGTLTIDPGIIDITDPNGVGVPLITGITESDDLADGKILSNVTVNGASDATFVVAKTNGEKLDIVVYKRLPVVSDATAVKVPIAWMKSNAASVIAGQTTIGGVETQIQTVRGLNGCTYLESYALGLTPSNASSVPTAGMTVNGDNFEIFLTNAVVPEGVVLGLSADTAAPGETFDDADDDTPTSVAGNGTNVSGSKVVIPISDTAGTQRYRLKISISGPSDPTP